MNGRLIRRAARCGPACCGRRHGACAGKISLRDNAPRVVDYAAVRQLVHAAGWRPCCGWIGGIALGYAAIIEPAARFIAAVAFHYTGAFPVIDNTITMQVLMGMLGLGAMRSYDKMQGTSPSTHG